MHAESCRTQGASLNEMRFRYRGRNSKFTFDRWALPAGLGQAYRQTGIDPVCQLQTLI